MGMQSKAWSSAELKKKTIKDVNEAIENGDIEIGGGGDLHIEYNVNGEWIFTVNEDIFFEIYPHYIEEELAFILNETYGIYFRDSEGNEYINLKYNSDNGYIEGEIGYSMEHNIASINLGYDAGLDTSLVTIPYISTSNIKVNNSMGSSGQVLGKDTNNKLAWVTPKKLYRHVISITATTSAPNSLGGIMEIYNNSDTRINSAQLLQDAISEGNVYGNSLPFNGCLYTDSTKGDSLHYIYGSSNQLSVYSHNAGTKYSLLSGYTFSDYKTQIL